MLNTTERTAMEHLKQYTPDQLHALNLLLDAHPGGVSTDDPPQRAVFDSLVARGGIARLEDADTPSGDHYVLTDEYVEARRAAEDEVDQQARNADLN
jgi:hypothetical protein